MEERIEAIASHHFQPVISRGRTSAPSVTSSCFSVGGGVWSPCLEEVMLSTTSLSVLDADVASQLSLSPLRDVISVVFVAVVVAMVDMIAVLLAASSGDLN